jgi:hypothetical protein
VGFSNRYVPLKLIIKKIISSCSFFDCRSSLACESTGKSLQEYLFLKKFKKKHIGALPDD